MDRLDTYLQWKRRTQARRTPCTLTFEQWCAAWDESRCYGARGGRNGYVMAQSVPGDGFVTGNVEIIPKAEAFRRTMDLHWGGERDYLP